MSTLSHLRRVEECGICYDQFEWISLVDDKSDFVEDDEDINEILSALEESSVDEDSSSYRYSVSYNNNNHNRDNTTSSTSSYNANTTTTTTSSSSSNSRTNTTNSNNSDNNNRKDSTSPLNSSPSYSKPSPPSSLESQGLHYSFNLSNPFAMFRTPEPKPKPKPKVQQVPVNSFKRPTSSRQPILYDSEETLSLGTSLSCNQGHLYCFVCIEKYLDGQMKDGVWPILCPDVDCKKSLTVNVVESILGAKAAKWHQMGVEHAVKKQLYCPNTKCNKLIDGEGLNVTDEGGKSWEVNATCPYCDEEFCALCFGKGHEGKSCNRVKQESNSDNLFDTLALQKSWKKCPGCGHMVEKTQGCNHMTCRCRKEFCYVCPSGVWPCRHSH